MNKPGNLNNAFATLLQNTSDIVICLATDFTITLFNVSAEWFYGWSFREIAGKNFLKLCHHAHYTCPIPANFFNNPKFFNINLDIKNASGKNCNLNWVICPVTAVNDQIQGAMIIGKDIELKKNNITYYLNGIIDSVPGCLYWKDCNGRYLGCNGLTAKLAGLSSPYEIIGKTDWELWGQQAPDLIKNDEEVITQGRTILVKEELKIADGQWMYFTGVKMPLRDKNNRIIGIIGNSLDISEFKNTQVELQNSKEQAEAANKAKSAFIANISHDIRMPLTGVIGISEILTNNGDSKKDRDYGHIIQESSEKLLSLLNDILEIISADEIKEENLCQETFNLRQRINQIVEVFRPNADLKQIKLKTIIGRGVPEYVTSDRVKLDRILLNLVSNALKFTHRGEIKLTATLSSKVSTKGWIRFTVSDTGVGIPDNKIEHIFDRFFRATPAYEGKYEGFGIGLFLVKRFVELLGGHITVESRLEEGSTFNVLLSLQAGKQEDVFEDKPIDTGAHIKKTSPKDAYVPKIKSYKKPDAEQQQKVLLIEDDAIARQVARATLQAAEFEVEETDNAEMGFKYVIENCYNLIVTDIGLPGMNGNCFASLVRSWEEATNQRHVPIIGFTAHGGSKAWESLQAGMNELLAKPMSRQKIEEIKQKFVIDQGSPAQSTSSETSEKSVMGLGFALPLTEKKLFELVSYPLLDQEEGIINAGGDPAFLNELLDMLVNKSIPEETALLYEAHDVLDWQKIRGIAHKLKGAAIYCGTTNMKYACQYMERYILAGHSKLREQLYEQLMRALAETAQHVKYYLESIV